MKNVCVEKTKDQLTVLFGQKYEWITKIDILRDWKNLQPSVHEIL